MCVYTSQAVIEGMRVYMCVYTSQAALWLAQDEMLPRTCTILAA